MKSIQEAVCACLEARSGVPAVKDRSLCRVYPMLAVSVRENGTVLLDGGRQAEHSYQVTVTAVSDQDREENTALLSALVPLLLQGVPLESEDRVLHPLDIRTEGGELTFTIVLCRCLPNKNAAPGDGPGRMETLHIGLRGAADV